MNYFTHGSQNRDLLITSMITDWIERYDVLLPIIRPVPSLLAETLFLLFADGRKETSAMGRKWLWFNRRPQSWTALFKTHAACIARWLQLEPVASRAFIYTNFAVIYWAHIVNMTCSDRREQSACRKSSTVKSYVSLLSSVLDNLDDGKIKEKWATSSSRPCFIFKPARHVCVLAERA